MVRAQKLGKEAKIKKKWYEILAPKIFNEIVIGETIAPSPDAIIGRSITANLMDITGNIKKQNINVKFRISGTRENRYGTTELVAYEMMPALIRRIVRRDRDTINDSFVVKTADDRYVRVKPFLLTAANTSRGVIANLRRSTRYFAVKHLSEKKYYDFVSDVISSKFQSELNGFLRKKYPLRVCEIRKFEIVAPSKALNVQKNAVFEEEAPREEETLEDEHSIIENIKGKESAEHAEHAEHAEQGMTSEAKIE